MWHAKGHTTNDLMRHPVDSLSLHPTFASKHRNVRLGLSSDGFNPFFMFSLLIPGLVHSYKFLNLINIRLLLNFQVVHAIQYPYNICNNILITFGCCSAPRWLLVKLTGAPQRFKHLILGSCVTFPFSL